LNVQVPRPLFGHAPTTQAGEGFPRRAFTVGDVLKMQHYGIIDEDEKFELVRGEILPMNAEGTPHLRAKLRLTRFFVTAASESVNVLPDSTMYLSEDTFFEPDFYMWPAEVPLEELEGHKLLLVVEMAHTSLKKDLTLKVKEYGRHHVPEYWVIDLRKAVTVVHRGPGAEGYREVSTHAGDEVLTPLGIPHLRFRLADHVQPF